MTSKYADAESEYAKDSNIRREDVKILQDWLNKQPHLPKISEFKVILFLQSCYYRIETAKSIIENHYTVKAHCPEIFTNRSVSAVETAMKLSGSFLLPKPSVNDYRVMLGKIIDPSPDQFVCNDLLKYFDMAVSLILKQIGSAKGHVLIVDMEGASFGHIAKVNIVSTKKYVYFLQEAMPVRVKEIHLINVSPISQRLISLVKPFLKNEIIDMLHFHMSLDTLYDYVPKESLPHEYGGKAGTVREILDQQRLDFLENEKYFLEEQMEVADESKRLGKPKNSQDIFGLEGTFKKLEID